MIHDALYPGWAANAERACQLEAPAPDSTLYVPNVTKVVLIAKFCPFIHCRLQVLMLLQLRLMADVALVGLPNVGKSSLIAALTGARAQVSSSVQCLTSITGPLL
jgi:ABC-type protease/lipase transport system fused ATPase/permease subunit